MLLQFYLPAKTERRTPPESHLVHKAIFPPRRLSGLNSLPNTRVGSWSESFGLATGMHLRRGCVSAPKRSYTNTPRLGMAPRAVLACKVFEPTLKQHPWQKQRCRGHTPSTVSLRQARQRILG